MRPLNRRRRWQCAIALLVGLPFLAAVWGFGIEPSLLVVRETQIPLSGWPSGLKGLRVAVLSDLHAGSPFITQEKIQRIVRDTNARHPDLIVLPGDFVIQDVLGGHFMTPETIAGNLRGLHAPLGVFVTLGNHDAWLDGRRVTAAFEAVGIPVLQNRAVRLERDGVALWVAGLGDWLTGSPDIAGVLAGIHDAAPVLAVTHNPDLFPDIPPRVSLTIAGHTHGGQVVLPFFGRLVVPSIHGQRYARGTVVEKGRHLFVSSGIGTSLLPVRLGVPPEIALLTLE